MVARIHLSRRQIWAKRIWGNLGPTICQPQLSETESPTLFPSELMTPPLPSLHTQTIRLSMPVCQSGLRGTQTLTVYGLIPELTVILEFVLSRMCYLR